MDISTVVVGGIFALGSVVGGGMKSVRKHRRGFVLIGVVMFLLLFMFAVEALYIPYAQIETMRNRAYLLQRAVDEMVEVIRRQAVLYAIRRNAFYAATEVEQSTLKGGVLSSWFDRTMIESDGIYSYEDVKSRFGAVKFDTLDGYLAPTTLSVKTFIVSVPRQVHTQTYEKSYQFDDIGRLSVGGAVEQDFSSVVYDANGFVVACNVVVQIEMDDGYWLPPLLDGRINKRRSGVKIIWKRAGVTITIPILIEKAQKI